MTKDAKRRKYCGSCRDDFYNGNNPMGVTECFMLETAKPIRMKFVHVDQRPPWNNKPEWTLDCCHRERFIKVKPNVNR